MKVKALLLVKIVIHLYSLPDKKRQHWLDSIVIKDGKIYEK